MQNNLLNLMHRHDINVFIVWFIRHVLFLTYFILIGCLLYTLCEAIFRSIGVFRVIFFVCMLEIYLFMKCLSNIKLWFKNHMSIVWALALYGIGWRCLYFPVTFVDTTNFWLCALLSVVVLLRALSIPYFYW